MGFLDSPPLGEYLIEVYPLTPLLPLIGGANYPWNSVVLFSFLAPLPKRFCIFFCRFFSLKRAFYQTVGCVRHGCYGVFYLSSPFFERLADFFLVGSDHGPSLRQSGIFYSFFFCEGAPAFFFAAGVPAFGYFPPWLLTLLILIDFFGAPWAFPFFLCTQYAPPPNSDHVFHWTVCCPAILVASS